MPSVGKEQIKRVKEKRTWGNVGDVQGGHSKRKKREKVMDAKKEKGMRKSVLAGLILREPMRWVMGEEG